MAKIIKGISGMLNFFIAAAISLMTIFVFGNVVLRYVFNSGITWSEELSRFLFIWMIFLGSILGLKDNEHLGVDMLVKKLSAKGRKLLYVISNLLIMVTLVLLFDGSWKLTMINLDQTAPATGMPYFFIYGIGLVTSVGMMIIVLANLYRVLSASHDDNDFVMTTDSEELTLQEELEHAEGEAESEMPHKVNRLANGGTFR